VSPLRGEKPQNRHLSKLNTGRFALRAMLPVKIKHLKIDNADNSIWFQMSFTGLRGHDCKLYKQPYRLTLESTL